MSKAKGKGPAVAVEEVPPEPTNGTGQFSLPDRSKYEGDWTEIAGVKTRNGHGTFIIGSEIYTGQWVNDSMNGTGEIVFGSGAKYTGNFKNNVFEGEGNYSFSDGSSYSGSWQNNKMHGHGVYTDPKGLVTTGQFVNGIYASGEKSH